MLCKARAPYRHEQPLRQETPMSVRQIENITELQKLSGQEVALSDWLEVSQERINLFAEATEDRQWIHTEPERASQESPFKTTIAHGFLTLSLLSELMKQAMSVGGVRMGINYGLNRVRFVSPLPAGARIRGRFTLAEIEAISGGMQATWNVSVEREGGDKPCCVAEWLVRYYV
jgi:acyl dehydratase